MGCRWLACHLTGRAGASGTPAVAHGPGTTLAEIGARPRHSHVGQWMPRPLGGQLALPDASQRRHSAQRPLSGCRLGGADKPHAVRDASPGTAVCSCSPPGPAGMWRRCHAMDHLVAAGRLWEAVAGGWAAAGRVIRAGQPVTAASIQHRARASLAIAPGVQQLCQNGRSAPPCFGDSVPAALSMLRALLGVLHAGGLPFTSCWLKEASRQLLLEPSAAPGPDAAG